MAYSNSSTSGELHCHLKILIPYAATPSIYEKLTAIVEESRAVITVPAYGSFFPGTEEIVLLVSGSISQVHLANFAIMVEVANVTSAFSTIYVETRSNKASGRDRQVKLLIPQTAVGKLIGKGGWKIKKICKKSGCVVHISDHYNYSNLTERCVTVVGDIDENEFACLNILKVIAAFTNVDDYLNVNYPVGNCPLPTIFPVEPTFQTGYKNCRRFTFQSDSNLNFIAAPARNLYQFSDIEFCEFLNKLKILLEAASYSSREISEACNSLLFLHNYDVFGVCAPMLIRHWFGGTDLYRTETSPSFNVPTRFPNHPRSEKSRSVTNVKSPQI